MNTSDYIIYSIANCVHCENAKSLLRSKGEAFHDIAVDMKPELGKSIVEQTKLKTWPQIFYKGNFIGGYNDLVESYE